MQSDRSAVIRRIASKELTLFFAAPTGYLFLAAFLAVTLFVFFWVEAWFARSVADVRPMFEWLPVLLMFLSSALTMRMWSEERRSGTMELVFTAPASTWEFVLGKFLACWALIAIALALTLPLPISAAWIADLDWGPVVAGYVAALLLGGAYTAIGLFVSARTDSQIVSLIVASFACGAFYLIGSPVLTELMSGPLADFFRGIGSGSRFEAITRGVLDLRDLYYYVSLGAVFLALNVHGLEVQRWARDGDRSRHSAWLLGTGLLVANLLAANLWLGSFTGLRVDMTQGRIYSISDATRAYLGRLQEPLLIRGYFSDQTHPLLAPLVPRMRDLLTEFEVAGQGKVRVEIIDPADDPELEDEANTKYGIRSVPFQVADRYQSSLVNSYFDVLLSYGDEYEVLGFRDLIEVKVQGEDNLDVQLRNPEYDLTRTIKKVLFGFQGGSSVFANIQDPVRFVGYLSDDDKLPEALAEYRSVLTDVLDTLEMESAGKLAVEIVDPQAGDGALAEEIEVNYGLQPMATLFDPNVFYFYLTLTDGQSLVQMPLPDPRSAEATKRSIEEGLKRFATGLLRTVALVAPPAPPPYMAGQGMGGNQFNQLQGTLANDFNVEATDLSDGVVPEAADLLMVVDPTDLSEKQLFAADQFLMKGGTVVIAAGAYEANLSGQSLTATRRNTGLEDWLDHHGIGIGDSLVMDPANAAFPVPVTRRVGGFSFQELVMLDYPYFPDIRAPGLSQDSLITTALPQVTMAWASPVEVDAELNADREVTELLRSSPGSWLSSSTDVMPRVNELGLSAFEPEGDQAARLVGVAVSGRFESFFKGKDSPLLVEPEAGEEQDTEPELSEIDGDDEAAEDTLGVVSSVIERSPGSARLFVFASNSFLADQTLRMVGSADGTIYDNSVQMLVNAVDWSLEDRTLLGIRSRGNFNRTLPKKSETEQMVIEYLNYGLALAGIGIVYLLYRWRRTRRQALYQGWLAGEVA